MPLPSDHPAIRQARTVFPGNVVDADRGVPILKPGKDNTKLGAFVAKGRWAGMPIFSLTLEERATCPRTCHRWLDCYGNAMGQAARNRHGPALEARLQWELAQLNARYPAGFVVRLHVLGDFYSVAYVELWRAWLQRYRALRVWGYTAWPPSSPIGAALQSLASRNWSRFAIRRSAQNIGPARAVTVASAAEGRRLPNTIVCPVETRHVSNCGACGLCWANAARNKTIAFILHGDRRSRETAGAIMDAVWTPELIRQLTELWKQGMATAEIGRRLGVTKNAVIGKAHRLDLPPRPSPLTTRYPQGKRQPAAEPGADL